MPKRLQAACLAAALARGQGDLAAAEAASYWRGGRVRAAEEPLKPTPDFENGTIDYHGEPQVQECMEYYLDKLLEEGAKQRLQRRESEALEESRRLGHDGEEEEARGVVTFLLMENADRAIHRDLLLSLRCLGRFFPKYPVVVFHTNASTAAELAWLREAAPRNVELLFEEVELGFPPSLAQAPGGPDAFLAAPRCSMDGRHWWASHRSCGCRCPAWRPRCWPVNWMHATRFFTAGMFRTRTLRRFSHFLRMDTDLFFVREPDTDPLRLMAQRGCGLVYDRVSREAPGCFDGFDLRTLDFMRRWGYHGAPDSDLLHVGSGPAAVGGQWTAGDVRLFSSERYLRFADHAASGIYSERWADQLFLMRGLALFGPRSGEPVQPARGSPAPSLCLSDLFREGGVEAGFVHQKAGFRDRALLERCGAQDLFR